jgi:opacity protein-like surface antigen
MASPKVKTYEKYVVGDMKKTHAFACDIIKPPDGSRSAQNKLAMKSIKQRKMNYLLANKKGIQMKKIIFAVLTLSVIGFSISESQLIRGYGIKVGVASTSQNWEWAPTVGVTAASTAAHQSLEVGTFIEWLDIPLFSVLTEIQYIRKGSDVTTNVPMTTIENPDGNGQFISYSTEISYLSVPILAKLRMNGGLLSPYIVAGPRFDFCLTSSGAFSKSDLKTMNVGGTFGVGVESASILPIQVGLEFRYSPDSQASYSTPSLTVKNRSLELLLVLSM